MDTPRLVASDVDGTLLSTSERVSARTAATVARVVATGTPFVLVTGRPPRWVPPVVEGLGHGGYAVCANGAVLYDSAEDKVLDATVLHPVLMRDVVGALERAMPGVMLAAERVGHSAHDDTVRQFVVQEGYHHPWFSTDHTSAARDVVIGLPAVKLLVRHTDMTSAEMSAVAAEVLSGAVDVTYSSGDGLIELSVAGVTKATGLAAIAERFGLDSTGVVAFGDMPNDVSMLRWAQHGVAMGNAHPEVLAVADEVTATNSEDGVAQVLDRWF